MMKFLRYSLFLFLIIIILFAATICFIFYTETGLNWSLAAAKKLTNQQLSYSEVSGTLADKIIIKQLNYSSPTFTMDVNNAALKLNPWDLLLLRLNIHTITIKKINISQTLIAADNKAFNLPLTIVVDNGDITNFHYNDNKGLSVNSKNLFIKNLLLSNDQIAAQLSWDKLHLKQQYEISLNNGRLKVQGKLTDYTGRITSTIIYDKYPAIAQQSDFHGNLNAITFQKMQMQTVVGSIQGSAMIGWRPQLQAELNLHATAINSAGLKTPVTAQVGFDLAAAAKKTAAGWTGFINLTQLSGKISNKSFNAVLNTRFSPTGFNIAKAQINFGDSSIKASGGLNAANWNLNWAIDVKDFRDFLDIGSGSLVSEGNLTGAENNPEINLSAVSNNLNLLGLKAGNVNASLHFNQTAMSPSTLQLTDVQFKNFYVKTLHVEVLGTLAAHTLQLSAVNNYLNLQASLKGGWNQQQWQGDITQLTLTDPLLQQWRMPAATQLIIGKNLQQLDHLCLAYGTQSVCSALLNTPQQSKVTGNLANINIHSLLDFFDPNLFKNIETNSVINGSFNLQKNKSINGEINLAISPGVISLKNTAILPSLQIKPSTISGKIINNQLNLAALINFNKAQTLTANITIGRLDQPLQQQQISGVIHSSYNDLSLLPTFLPLIKKADGDINGTIKISGKLNNPTLMGQLKLSRGSAVIPTLGITLKNVTITADGSAAGKVNLSGTANTDTGILHLTGNAALFDSGLPMHLVLTGQRVLMMNTKEYKIYASPNVTIDKTGNKFLINGTVNIPAAVIAIDEFSGSSESLSSDVQFVDQQQSATNIIYSGDLRVVLGDDVKLNIRGLIGQLTGAVQVNLDSAANTTANGTLSIVSGQYTGYGQTLAIQTGKIFYTNNSIKNPGIELVGSKTVLTTATASNTLSRLQQSFTLPPSYSGGKEVKVGIRVTGTLNHYTTALFSDPAIYSQSDILSLLLTGQSTDGLSGNSAQALMSAASGLNLGGGVISNITQHLQQFFGLDQLGVGSQSYIADGTANQATALTLGKRLTPRLSVNYSVGFLNPINIFIAKYRLSENWNLQATASIQGTGADIFYNVER